MNDWIIMSFNPETRFGIGSKLKSQFFNFNICIRNLCYLGFYSTRTKSIWFFCIYNNVLEDSDYVHLMMRRIEIKIRETRRRKRLKEKVKHVINYVMKKEKLMNVKWRQK